MRCMNRFRIWRKKILWHSKNWFLSVCRHISGNVIQQQSFHQLGYFDPEKMCVLYILTQYPDKANCNFHACPENLWQNKLWLRETSLIVIVGVEEAMTTLCRSVPKRGRDQEPSSKELLVRFVFCLALFHLFRWFCLSSSLCLFLFPVVQFHLLPRWGREQDQEPPSKEQLVRFVFCFHLFPRSSSSNICFISSD